MSTAALKAHLATGAAHVCHCWAIERRDGLTLGFTDHDCPVNFDGMTFHASNGLSARALSSTTGLSVNNTEALGVLQSDAITEADIEAGRYDGAKVTTWLVQWDAPEARQIRFVGTIGEITRASGGFQAELRGLTDALNQPQGRSYLKTCSALLGGKRCGVDLTNPMYRVDLTLAQVTDRQVFQIGTLDTFNDRWFEGGVFEVLTGAAAGLKGAIKLDQPRADLRIVTLWEPIHASIIAGDTVRLTAGCDKRLETCRVKFDNMVNFQGFPDIPGEDWLVSVPRSNGRNVGGSRTK